MAAPIKHSEPTRATLFQLPLDCRQKLIDAIDGREIDSMTAAVVMMIRSYKPRKPRTAKEGADK